MAFPDLFSRNSSRDSTGAAPLILTHRRIYILPTRTGMLFVVVLLLMLTGAVNYNLSLGHALVFLLAGLFFVAIIHTFRNLLGLRIVSGHAAPIFAGDIAKFPIFLENSDSSERRILEFSLQSKDSSSGISNEGVSVAANTSASATVPCQTTRRGLFHPGRITLSSCYPLGLFRAWTHLYPKTPCLVYPQPIKTPLPESAFVPTKNDQCHGEKGQDDFAGLRLHQPNESFRHVAWKAAARDTNRPLMTKQFSGGGTQALILDWALTPSKSDMETRLSILAGWVLESEKQQIAYGLRLPGHFFAPSLGTQHRDTCLKALALHA